MSDNEFDAERDRAEEAPDNLVLTGEEIELPGEDSDASAIIGESSEPIHTGEIEGPMPSIHGSDRRVLTARSASVGGPSLISSMRA